MNKPDNPPVKIIEDELWDHYSGLPNPMWYKHISEIEDEEDTSNSANTSVTPE